LCEEGEGGEFSGKAFEREGEVVKERLIDGNLNSTS
jgi:hypothetical protein